MGDMLQLLLMLLDGGDIGKQRDKMICLSLGIVDGADRQQLGIDFAVFTLVPYLSLPVFELCQVFPHGRVEGGGLYPGTLKTGVESQHFFLAETGDLIEGLIDIEDRPLGVGDHDAFISTAENAGGKLQLLF